MASIWASRSFYASCDVDLDLKIYVGSLQLRRASVGAGAGSGASGGAGDCYVSLQLLDDGAPLHPFARSTQLGVARAGRVQWNEWVALPVRVRDLPRSAQLAVRVWAAGNELVAGATIMAFDHRLALRRGLSPAVLWRSGVAGGRLARLAAGAPGPGLAGDELAAAAADAPLSPHVCGSETRSAA
jgi:hypothetical protein